MAEYLDVGQSSLLGNRFRKRSCAGSGGLIFESTSQEPIESP
ncbi:hypothetical protein BCL90_2261 [Pedobacter alluvionis]|uniref:Uncharacterized protein n=1 Tax=Pedobacter alluvionis TaxID=475253 RepID=A0A497Y5W9_9SPHI|nr:hypothetical protein BCL90_2261 [Pedobacter alluvionis]